MMPSVFPALSRQGTHWTIVFAAYTLVSDGSPKSSNKSPCCDKRCISSFHPSLFVFFLRFDSNSSEIGGSRGMIAKGLSATPNEETHSPRSRWWEWEIRGGWLLHWEFSSSSSCNWCLARYWCWYPQVPICADYYYLLLLWRSDLGVLVGLPQ